MNGARPTNRRGAKRRWGAQRGEAGGDSELLGNEGLLRHGRAHVAHLFLDRVGLGLGSRFELDGFGRRVIIRNQAQHMGNAVEARVLLAVRSHHVPGGCLNVGVGEHFVLGLGILDPAAS